MKIKCSIFILSLFFVTNIVIAEPNGSCVNWILEEHFEINIEKYQNLVVELNNLKIKHEKISASTPEKDYLRLTKPVRQKVRDVESSISELKGCLQYTIQKMSNINYGYERDYFEADETKDTRLSKHTTPLIIDLVTGEIENVNLDKTIETLKTQLDNSRTEIFFESLEGGVRSELLVIWFGSESVWRHWNGWSFRSPAIRTKEGIGVGSKLSDLVSIYGNFTQGMEGIETPLFRVEIAKGKYRNLYASIPYNCKSLECIVTRIWVNAPPY